MKLSELKAIIVECLNESGPARLKRRASGEHIQDVGGRGDNQNPIRYDSEGNQLPKRARIMGTPNSTHVKYRGSGKNRQSDSTTGVRKYRGSFKKLGEEKKYNATPPLKGFNRTEPMAYKKNSLSGKIAGLNKKMNGKVDK